MSSVWILLPAHEWGHIQPPPLHSAMASVGSGQDQWPPEKAVIRIHFFLLCALVHCLSSSVQCNQVNERACNEAIRCSLVLWARHSILSSQTPALSAQCRLGWGGSMGGMDTGCTEALIQDLAFHRLVDGRFTPGLPSPVGSETRPVLESPH